MIVSSDYDRFSAPHLRTLSEVKGGERSIPGAGGAGERVARGWLTPERKRCASEFWTILETITR